MNSKKNLSVFVALIVVISAFAAPKSVYAGEFTETVEAFTYENYEIPAYDGDLYEEVNGNKPTFTAQELNQNIYEEYAPLDNLGRVGECEANIDRTLMPTEPRGDISSVYPTGWVQNKYEFVSGKYLYNRSHLIGWQLTAENANKQNLMTGTRTFNASGMLPFENEVATYVKANAENNVLYRVTPVFQGDNLLATGVIMEAESVDDLGASVSFCVFVYNVEPGVSIDYSTGENVASGNIIDISGALVWLKAVKYTYTGKKIEPLDYVKVDNVILTKGTNYTVEYKNNVKIGTATVIVKGVYPYSGTVSKTFRIVKPSPPKTSVKKLKAKSSAFFVKWKKVSGISGYQIQYSTNKNFKGAKKVFVNSKSAVSKTVKNLKAQKVYYVRVRTYKTVNKTKYFSSWSGYKSVKTR